VALGPDAVDNMDGAEEIFNDGRLKDTPPLPILTPTDAFICPEDPPVVVVGELPPPTETVVDVDLLNAEALGLNIGAGVIDIDCAILLVWSTRYKHARTH
jgi:hypothetical protein